IGADATGNLIQGNAIGTDKNGTARLGNEMDGILIAFAANNTIGGSDPDAGNLISGNKASGVRISGSTATGNLVAGNRIGTDAGGRTALGNADGVRIEGGATNNTIGGPTAEARNVISGNAGDGVDITDSGTTGNVLAGNYIGTNSAGTAALANAGAGILINTGASNNTIGGTSAAARNVISGNTTYGIEITDAGTTGNVVEGNYIGTDTTGTQALGNSNTGLGNGAAAVLVESGASGNTIGRTAAGAGNLISGNTAGDGVQIFHADDNAVEGNLIGTTASGNAALGNLAGIVIVVGSGNLIGVPGAGNVISGNTGQGLFFAGADGNTAAGNTIGLGADGSTPLGNGASGIVLDDAPNNT